MNRQVKILLVDDNEESLVALEAVLRPLQQLLFKARSGPEAMKLMLRHDFAVVLLDVLMPGMDGFETATHIKRLDQTRDVPIIFLTGTEPSSGAAFRGYAVGAVDYLTKPFDPWVLRSKVAVFMELFRKNAVLSEQTALLSQLVQDDAALEDFARRLGSVESRLHELGEDTTGDEGLMEAVKDLADRVAAMQAAFEAVSTVRARD
ncbi:Response regulator receiver domain-containing protein [Nonomuraea solani]|uniref:Response regulator receiver domain-containing protein n=1 Tax=Nonomuraea solani TaxID=1144553 RepID=A0A1H5TNB7_9ACTN|nr:response regulator [Nonomuraea solani]SEF64273.1 Response regulator receiver domain-containing protein [Nonomuraea solani]